VATSRWESVGGFNWELRAYIVREGIRGSRGCDGLLQAFWEPEKRKKEGGQAAGKKRKRTPAPSRARGGFIYSSGGKQEFPSQGEEGNFFPVKEPLEKKQRE